MTGRRQRLAGRRRALGFSQELLAAELGVDRTTIGRWERGETDPQPYIRPRLSAALHVTTAELDTLITPGPDPEKPPPAPRDALGSAAVFDQMGEPDDMHRRELLRLLSIAAVTVTMPADASASTGSLAAGDTARYTALNAQLWQLYGTCQAKGQVYPLVRQQIAVLTAQMGSGQPEAAHRQLCALACDLFQLAGEICFDGNRYTEAAHCSHICTTFASRVSLR